jgi:hypothetical protein
VRELVRINLFISVGELQRNRTKEKETDKQREIEKVRE